MSYYERIKRRNAVLGAAVLAIAALAIMLLAGCAGPDHVRADAPQARAKNVILIIGDGFQLEHERAYNHYLTGSYDSGLRHQGFPYRGTVTTWDVTTYNRYAYTAGAPSITDDGFDPQWAGSFDPLLGYDLARGGALPWPESPVAALNSAAGRNYYGAKRKLSNTDKGAIAATDSASAATALATGFKTDDGNLAWRTGDKPDGSLKTIAEMLRAQKGGAIGVVTTVPFSHATPAAFVSHNVSRNHYQAIAREIVTKTQPDVVIGAGHPDFTSAIRKPDYTYIGAPVYDALKKSDKYVLAERRTGIDGGQSLLAAAGEAARAGRKLFGLYGGHEGNFEYAVPSGDGSSAVARGSIENPTLADASTAALTVLSRNPNGFFLMIEQGNIDWANHANHYRNLIGSMSDLDRAVRAVEAYVDRPGDDIDWSNTVLIVTTDHANSFMRIDPSKKLGKGRLPLQQSRPQGSAYLGAYMYPNREITYGPDGNGTGSHFNEPVTLYAKGPEPVLALFRSWEGAWYPGTTLIDNTQVFRVMMTALGLDDENRSGR